MLIVDTAYKNTGRLLLWQLSEEEEELRSCFSSNELNELENDLAKRRHARRRKEFLVTHLLLKHHLGWQKIQYYPSGKPFLRQSEISISHTKGLVALLLHPCDAVGIDVELVDRNVEKVLERFTGPKERLWLGDRKENILSLLVWCAKEALYKFLESPSEDFDSSMEVLPIVLEEEYIYVKDLRSEESKLYRFSFVVKKKYVLVWGGEQCVE